MYSFIKKSIKALIPKNFLFKNELFFRFFYGIFYLGRKHECSVCARKLKSFVKIESGDMICPFCGSLARNRRLWLLLNKNNSITDNVLHFSPSRNLYRKLISNKDINYFSTDFTEAFLADYKFDITDIDQNSEKFDTIICYHILEHIVDDLKAMSELYRVLKPNGIIYLQTPFKEGEIYEDYSIITPEERTKHFGQFDHVRIYSINGLRNRLQKIGFNVEIKTFINDETDYYHGLTSGETIFLLKKN